jgi:hypothetical protein
MFWQGDCCVLQFQVLVYFVESLALTSPTFRVYDDASGYWTLKIKIDLE